MFHLPVIGVTAVVEVVLAALSFNQTSQYIVLAIGLGGAFAYSAGKLKEQNIDGLKQAVENEKTLHSQTQQELEGASRRADAERDRRHELETKVATAEKEVEILKRYISPEAFHALVHELGEIRGAMAVAIGAQGDLIRHNTDLQSQGVKALERVADDLSRLAERLGAGGDTPAPVA